MMDLDELYSLKWNAFRSDFTEGFRDFLKEETMVDVTLSVEGKILQAHKLVLSVCSPFFKHLFKTNPCKHPIVILNNVSHRVLSHMLDFMYIGKVDIQQEDLTSFLHLAETFNIKGLAGELERKEYTLLHQRRRTETRKSIQPTQSTSASESDGDNNSNLPARPAKRRLKQSGGSKRKARMKLQEIKARTMQDDESEDSDSSPLAKLTHSGSSTGTKTGGYGHQVNEDVNMVQSISVFRSERTRDPADHGIQGGVDYQMIQTKRGRDMLLYDGYTFTQNRMCKDGMRWQCSYPKCKAFCRMSSAGWLTPYKNQHDHERPPEEEIRRRILRMELKARAESSGATPGEIIRNALPANEYQTTDQRACYTRCIQRYRKSLLRKSTKQNNIWTDISDRDDGASDSWLKQDKSNVPPKSEEDNPLVAEMWSTHAQPVQLTEDEKHMQLSEQKDNTHTKLGAFEL